MTSNFLPALRMLVAFTVLTGFAYPLLTTGIARIAFPAASTGSVVETDGKPVGSRLLGQPFSSPRYFWSRPSATAPQPYNGAASSGSNLGARNPALADAVAARIAALREADPGNDAAVPVDLVTASASGLDPHISLAAAQYQVARVARARGVPEAAVHALLVTHTEPRALGVLGEPRVNVVLLNLALDRARP